MFRTGGLLFFSLLALLGLSACGSDSPAEGAAEADGVTVEVSCASHIQFVDEVGEGIPVIADGVAIGAYVSESGALVGQLGSERADADSAFEGLSFAKMGLLIRDGTTAVVTPATPADAVITWGDADASAAAGESLAFDACTSPDGGEWLVFAGGFWVSEPGCVALRVTVDGGDPVDINVNLQPLSALDTAESCG